MSNFIEYLRVMLLMVIAFLLATVCYSYYLEKQTIGIQLLTNKSQNEMITKCHNDLQKANKDILLITGQLYSITNMESKNLNKQVEIIQNTIHFIESTIDPKPEDNIMASAGIGIGGP